MRGNLHPYVRVVVNHSQKCNMRCAWCHEEGMQLVRNDSLILPSEIAQHCQLFHATGVRKFKLVGGEPTLRPDLANIIQVIREIDEAIDLSMVTNGTRLSTRAKEYVEAGLDRINVSLFTLDKDYFVANVGPIHLMTKVIAGIDRCVDLGVCGKINHVYHDKADLLEILAFARARSVRVNVLNQIPSISSPVGMPISDLLDVLYGLPVSRIVEEDDPYSLPVKVITLEDGTEIEVKHKEIGAQGRLSSCQSCSVTHLCKEGIFALRITPTGQLQPCIVRSDNSFDLTGNPSTEELKSYLAAL